MPTFEFYGYTTTETIALITAIKQQIGELPFCQDIVFVIKELDTSKVISWHGEEKPFVRILTRSSEKAEQLRFKIQFLSDVETVIIGYYPKT